MKKLYRVILLATIFSMMAVSTAFAASDTMTTASFVNAVVSKSAPELKSQSYEEQISALNAGGTITSVEASMLLEDRCPRSMVWRILLPVYGIYAYPTEVVAPDAPVLKGCEGVYHEARICVLQMGLATAEQADKPTFRMSAAEFRSLVSKLEAGKFGSQEEFLPEDMPVIPWLEGVEITSETYRGRNALLVSYAGMVNDLGKYMNDFESQGWTIRIGAYADLDGDPSNGAEYAIPGGSCCYRTREIWLNQATGKTPYHELGHYIAYRTGLRNSLPTLFAKEGKAVVGILGSYSQKSAGEFWAEVFGYYFYKPELRPALKEAAPLTVQVIEEALLAAGEGNLICVELAQSIIAQAR